MAQTRTRNPHRKQNLGVVGSGPRGTGVEPSVAFKRSLLGGYQTVLMLPEVPRVLASSILARVGITMWPLALFLLVRHELGSYSLAGAALGAATLGGALAAPLQGAVIDRYGQTRVLVVCGACYGVLVAVTGVSEPAAPTLLLLCLAGGVFTPSVWACARVLWPALTYDRTVLEFAYATDALAAEISFLAGPLVLALTLEVMSARASVLVAGALAVAGTAWFASSWASRRWRNADVMRRDAAGFWSRGLRAVIICIIATAFMTGAVQVALSSFAVQQGSPSAAGMLLTVYGVGSLVFGVWYGSRDWRWPLASRYVVLLVLISVLTLPLAFARTIPAALALSLPAGLGFAALISCETHLIGGLAATGTKAQAFNWSVAAIAAGFAAGSAAAGWVVEVAGVTDAVLLGVTVVALASGLAAGSRRYLQAVEAPTTLEAGE
jgi:MFS family permease